MTSINKQIETIKNRLIKRATKEGICENFGQKEIRELKEKMNFNELVYSYNAGSKTIVQKIDNLNEWAINYHL